MFDELINNLDGDDRAAGVEMVRVRIAIDVETHPSAQGRLTAEARANWRAADIAPGRVYNISKVVYDVVNSEWPELFSLVPEV